MRDPALLLLAVVGLALGGAAADGPRLATVADASQAVPVHHALQDEADLSARGLVRAPERPNDPRPAEVAGPPAPLDSDDRGDGPGREVPAADGPRMLFGLDAGSVAAAQEHGIHPDYGTLWVGQWTLMHGWGDTDKALAALRDAGVTPAVHLYYWGDDIHPDCFTVGCDGKDMAGWRRLTDELVLHLRDVLGDAPAMVILESEFNKHQVHAHEDLDGYLQERAFQVRMGYPNATLVLGLGNWYPPAWGTWDRAAAAVDAIGVQAIAGASRDPAEEARELFEATLEGVRAANATFGKPVLVHDVAVSSWPEPDNLALQEHALTEFAEGLDELRGAGAEAIVYRSLRDVPNMSTAEHYGDAERHWGLAWHDSGELKPGGKAWLHAMKEESQRGRPPDHAGPDHAGKETGTS